MVGGDGGLAEPQDDEGKLPRVGDDVPAGVDPGNAGGHGGVHLDLVLLQGEPPVGQGAELGDVAREDEDGVHLEGQLLLGLVVEDHRPAHPFVPLYPPKLVGGEDLEAPLLVGLHELLHARLVGPELGAAVDQGDAPGGVQKVQGPVHGAVPPAHDEDPLPLELGLALHGVVDAPPLKLPLPRRPDPPGLKGPHPGGDDHRLGGVGVPLGGGDLEEVSFPFQGLGPLPEAVDRVKGGHLLHQALHQVLGVDLGEAGHVVDVLLRVEGGKLPPGLGQGVHEAEGQPPHAHVKPGEKPCRPRPYDEHVRVVRRHACYFMHVGGVVYPTWRTTFPKTRRSSRSRCPSAAASRGRTWPTTGFSFPSSTKRKMGKRRLLEAMVEPRMES